MASNEDVVAVATWRDYDPEAAEKAAKEQQKAESKSARPADKKES